ncbi:hypothetical protein DPMN_075257 [Dreissena polymorpha]|uniref:Uncharacterized protein n=1 Tax=Dreissena polymorpha TaxID=45954 RepID=A0A9D3YK21_DREPO|nr:hypothetical protein DPMN_075257 [Dreissena polymorpha]
MAGSLAIDRSYGTKGSECFHTLNADGNYLIVELETTAKLVHVDILFRSDLLYDYDFG